MAFMEVSILAVSEFSRPLFSVPELGDDQHDVIVMLVRAKSSNLIQICS